MYRLVYISHSAHPFGPDDISCLLDHARKRNAADGITGLLLYHNQRFLQVLEGPRDKVEACYARIAQDPRHKRVGVLARSDAKSKFFSQWFMGYADPGALAGADPKAIITLDQLKARLSEVDSVETSQGRKDVMQDLKMYLRLVSQPATV